MLSVKLKTYRTINNLTKKEVAEYCNVSIGTINNYESGRTSPQIDTLKLLSRLYGIRIVDFFLSDYFTN